MSATQGSWQLLPFHSQVLAVHTAVLHTGKVLFFAGSGNSRTRFESPHFGDPVQRIWTSAVWDPAGGAGGFSHPATLRDAHGHVIDFFCGGDTFLADGRLLSAGGTASWQGNAAGLPGRRDVLAFDPQAQQWTPRALMVHGRWYPTLVTLGDGRVLITSGLRGNLQTNTLLEAYSPPANAWQILRSPQPPQFAGLPRYAHLLLLESGAVFFTGGRMDDPSGVGPSVVDVANDPVTVSPIGGLQDGNARDQSASVLLPPAQDQRVMIMGGAPVGPHAQAVNHCDIVDFKAAGTPTYRPAAPMHRPRIHLNAVLLPDRTVLVAGGARGREDRAHPTPEVEIYDPASDTWTLLAASTVTRLYHSVALLLPDARVLAAGGNPPPFGHKVPWEPPDPNEEMRIDIYSPPYLSQGPRPRIDQAPADWAYADTVSIGTAAAGSLKWASLVRNGVTTHSFNTGQRLVDLPIIAQGGGVLDLVTPAEPNIAPPGWYMLFLVDNEGVPSVAKWVRLHDAPPRSAPAGYEQVVRATPGLVGYWPLDEPAGTVAFDLLGDNHASYINQPARNSAAPLPGLAVELDGQSQYVLVPRLVRDDFTLELWFRSLAGGTGTGNRQWWEGAGLMDGEVAGVADDFGISLDASGQVWAGTGHPDTSLHSAAGLADGAWHHVAFTRVRHTGALSLYIDGDPAANGQAGRQALSAAPSLRAGSLQTGRNHLAAGLAHIAIYSAALTASTVSAHFAARP